VHFGNLVRKSSESTVEFEISIKDVERGIYAKFTFLLFCSTALRFGVLHDGDEYGFVGVLLVLILLPRKINKEKCGK
jgi:hypothetical protein